jgi:hypothetical protein
MGIENNLFETASDYFTLRDKRAFFVPANHITKSNCHSSVWITALKVASYMTVVIPLIMLAILVFVPRPVYPASQIHKRASPVNGLKKVYCFGDIHGELEGFQENLRAAKVVDRNNHWRGGNSSTIVQMGDVIDRGPQSAEAYYYLEGIQQQAQQHGGKVVRLIGNHELMLLRGDFYFTNFSHPDELAMNIKSDIIAGKVQAAYYDGKYLYVHGGLLTSIRNQLIKEICLLKGTNGDVAEQEIADYINCLVINAVQNDCFDHPIFQAGKSRGGDNEDGGIFWADFHELVRSRHASDIPQIVAHTIPQPSESPIRYTESLRLCDVDAGLCECYGNRHAFIKVKEQAMTIYERIDHVWHKQKKPIQFLSGTLSTND